MKRLEEFRIFYNHTIHPELMRMERRRKRLLRLLFFSVFILVGLTTFALYIEIVALSLTLILPIVGYIIWLYFQIRKYIDRFKPNVIELVLDFVDNSMNYEEMKYDAKGKLSVEKFQQSGLFANKLVVYDAEDYITGQIGNIEFELCELDAKEFSPVRERLDDVFKGIFLRAYYDLKEPPEGAILIWPRKLRQFHTKAIKNFTANGGRNIDKELYSAPFTEIFTTYALEDTDVRFLLTTEMQHLIVDYQKRSGREMYLGIHSNEIFVFLSQDKDILEPDLFRPNVSFEMVREFFADIQLIVEVVEDLDRFY